MEYMNYASTKEAFEEELSSMGKSTSPVVSIHSDRQKVDIEVFTYLICVYLWYDGVRYVVMLFLFSYYINALVNVDPYNPHPWHMWGLGFMDNCMTTMIITISKKLFK